VSGGRQSAVEAQTRRTDFRCSPGIRFSIARRIGKFAIVSDPSQMIMDRCWLITSTFYGNWLPGDRRGFVGRVRDLRSGEGSPDHRIRHNQFGTEYDRDIGGLSKSARDRMKADPVCIGSVHAEILLTQFRETCHYRGWTLIAASIMYNHVHLMIGVNGDPAPSALLQSVKSYGSRALNRHFGKPAGETWWTSGGSTRILKRRFSIPAALYYVARKQPNPLIVFLAEEWKGVVEQYEMKRRASGGRQSAE
jgi:REP element-mobilizing transposase RayT